MQLKSPTNKTLRNSISVKNEGNNKSEVNETRREESSDESTIISSQASTLTRPAVVESCASTFCLAEEEEEDVLEQVFPLEVSISTSPFQKIYPNFENTDFILFNKGKFQCYRMKRVSIRKQTRNAFSYSKKEIEGKTNKWEL